MRPALIVAIGLAIFQQFIGINTIIYYAPTTLTDVGYSDASAIYANIAIGVLNVVMTVVPIRLVDRLGRKPLLVAGLGGMITSLTILGVSSLGLPEPNAPGDPAAIITLCAWPASSPRSRRRGARVVWVLQSFPLALDSFGPGPVFFGYAVIGLLALLFVKTMVTETRGRSLEEIEADL